MKRLVAVLSHEDGIEEKEIRVSIANELDQVAALIQSAKDVSTKKFFDDKMEACLFEVTKKGFVIYEETWGIFAPDIAEMMWKPYNSIVIYDFGLPEDKNNLENAIEHIEGMNIPIDLSKWKQENN